MFCPVLVCFRTTDVQVLCFLAGFLFSRTRPMHMTKEIMNTPGLSLRTIQAMECLGHTKRENEHARWMMFLMQGSGMANHQVNLNCLEKKKMGDVGHSPNGRNRAILSPSFGFILVRLMFPQILSVPVCRDCCTEAVVLSEQNSAGRDHQI